MNLALSGKVLFAAGAAGVLLLSGLGWQTWRLHQETVGRATAEASLAQCRKANEANAAVIQELEGRERKNTEQYEAALTAMAQAATRIQIREARGSERHQQEIERLRSLAGDNQCAHSDMPDDIRMRVNARAGRIPDGDGAP